MLQAYKNMESLGIIGKMMKVAPDGKTPIVDPKGDQPGTLIVRPFQEYPKAVRRVKVDVETGEEKVLTFVAGSKAEELRIMQDTTELDVQRSPLERERDTLAEDLNVQQKMNGQLASQLENALAKLNELSASVEKLQATKQPAGAELSAGQKKPAGGNAEALALLNQKQ